MNQDHKYQDAMPQSAARQAAVLPITEIPDRNGDVASRYGGLLLSNLFTCVSQSMSDSWKLNSGGTVVTEHRLLLFYYVQFLNN